MGSLYLRSGKTFSVSSTEAMDVHSQLPAANYVVKLNQYGAFYLEHVDSFTPPPKIYGKTCERSERILRTFTDRGSSTGVILAGEKGSGKTLLARRVCMDGVSQNIPTLIVNTPFNGDSFNAFIQSIEQPAIILFDEFEKVYDKDQQEGILTLLDGVFPTKKLFLITCNDQWKIDMNMRNRPGRIYYMFEFAGLEDDFIVEYCNDNLVNKTHADEVLRFSGLFREFNFDMLKAIVEEVNRYDEAPRDVLEVLNCKPTAGSQNENHEVHIFVNNVRLPQNQIGDDEWYGNPMKPFELHASYTFLSVEDRLKREERELAEDDDDDFPGIRKLKRRLEQDPIWHNIAVKHDQMSSFTKDSFVFDVDEKHRVVLKRKPIRSFDWRAV